jgi:hypothetical protein
MLRVHVMPRAHDAPLEQRECGLHGVCVNVAVGVVERSQWGYTCVAAPRLRRLAMRGDGVGAAHLVTDKAPLLRKAQKWATRAIDETLRDPSMTVEALSRTHPV